MYHLSSILETTYENFSNTINTNNNIDNNKNLTHMNYNSMLILRCRSFILRADCNRIVGRYQLALADYNEALESIRHMNNVELSQKIHSRFSLVHNEFGRVLFNRERYAEAAIEFSFAQKYSPNVSTYALNIGIAEYYMQRFDRAYECFKLAIDLDPNNSQAKLRLASFNQKK